MRSKACWRGTILEGGHCLEVGEVECVGRGGGGRLEWRSRRGGWMGDEVGEWRGGDEREVAVGGRQLNVGSKGWN